MHYEMRLHSGGKTSAEQLGGLVILLLVDDLVNAVVKHDERREYHTAVAHGVPVVGLELESPACALLGTREVTLVINDRVIAVVQALAVKSVLDHTRVESQLTPYLVKPVVDHSESARSTRAVKEVTGAPMESVTDYA